MTLKNQNPYWTAGTLEGKAYIERDADQRLRKELSDNQRFVFLFGPRRSGTSSLITHCMDSLSPGQYCCTRVDMSKLPQERDLPVEVRQARRHLVGQRLPVLRRPALHHVGDVDRLARRLDRLEDLVEQLPLLANERPPAQVLLLARPLTHAEQPRGRVALAAAAHPHAHRVEQIQQETRVELASPREPGPGQGQREGEERQPEDEERAPRHGAGADSRRTTQRTHT